MAIKKKKSGGGGANWMDTYGDMVTLLLCFFVLLYSMSTISEDNWKAIVMSFNPLADQTIREVKEGNTTGPSSDPGDSAGMMEMQEQVDEDIEMLFQALQEYVQQQNSEQTISVEKDGGKVFISFNQTVFFDGESAVLKPESEPVLQSVSDMLSSVSGSIDEVRVLGHTAQASANRPNRVVVDRTLASNRATNVVIFIQQHSSVDPARLVSEGIGQWRPAVPNDTPENRAKNRRVEMIISGRNIEQEIEDGILEIGM